MNDKNKHNEPERESAHERTLDAPLLSFSIKNEIEELKKGSGWQQGDRNAITLQKDDNLRVVLMSVHKGAVLQEHKAEGAITIFVVSGKMIFTTEQKKVTAETGDMIVVEKPLVHRVEALEETHFILTIVRMKQ
ncbi:MAG: cupin domain-containing protein [Syntrophomonadaceae bacterium]